MEGLKELDPNLLGDLAEDEVRRWCTRRGIVTNPAGRDRTGWDLIAEVPGQNRSHPEARPAGLTCFLQIKGTRSESGRISIKLDNWEHAVKRPIPFFFVIVEYAGNDVKSVAVVHVDQAWTAKVMQRLRSVDVDSAESIHKLSMSLTWSDSDKLGPDRGADLERRIREAIGTDQGQYIQRKISWLDDPESTIRVTLETRLPTDEAAFRAMADFAVGLRKELPVNILRIDRQCFGVTTSENHSRGPGSVELPEVPVAGSAELVLRDREFKTHTSVRCDFHSSKLYFPFLPEKYQKIRFRLPFLSVIMELGTNQTEFVFDLPEHGRTAELQELADAARMMETLARGAPTGLELSITIGGERIILPYAAQQTSALSPERQRLFAVIGYATALARRFGIGLETRVSIEELLAQRDPITFLAAADRGATGLSVGSELVGNLDEQTERAAFVQRVPVRLANNVLCGILVVEGKVEWQKNGDTWSFLIQNGQARLEGCWTVPVDEWSDFPHETHLKRIVDRLDAAGYFVLHDLNSAKGEMET